MVKALLAVNLPPEGRPGDQTMAPLQGLPWRGLATEAPGQPGTALLPLVKVCAPCLLLWLTMATTAMKNQTPQVGICNLVLLDIFWRLSWHIVLHSSCTTRSRNPCRSPSMFRKARNVAVRVLESSAAYCIMTDSVHCLHSRLCCLAIQGQCLSAAGTIV